MNVLRKRINDKITKEFTKPATDKSLVNHYQDRSELTEPSTKQLLQGCFSFTLGAFCVLAGSILTIFLLQNGPIKSVSYNLPSPRILDGALAKNDILKHVKQVMKNSVFGPESFATHKHFRTIYTGLKTGHLVELKATDSDTFIIQRSIHLRYGTSSNNCSGSYSDALKCGRPLGLRFRKKLEDNLLIADAYHGLYEFNVITANYKIILQPGTPIFNDSKSPPVRFFNDLDEMSDGETIIFTEPSTKFSDRDCLYALVEHSGDGRLLSYNVLSGHLKVLVDNLQYPNGVQIQPDGKCVLFVEMGNLRILRHCFGSSVAYTTVVDNLPGYPDNIRFSRDRNLWVPIGSVRLSNEAWITQRPFLRDMLAKLTTKDMFQWFVKVFSSRYAMILLVDPKSGEILRSYHDQEGSRISSVSQIEELEDGTLLLGGDENQFLGVLLPK